MTVPLAAMSHGQWDFVSSQIKLGLSSLRVLLDGFGRPLAPSEFCGVRHSEAEGDWTFRERNGVEKPPALYLLLCQL